MANEVASGARARFYLNGKQVGYATDVTVRRAINYQEVNVLDNIEVFEHVPVGYAASMDCGFVRLVAESIVAAGWFPAQAATPQEFLLNILTSGDLTASIEDSKTGKVLYNVEGVKMASEHASFQARGVTSSQCSFVAKRIRDEGEATP